MFCVAIPPVAIEADAPPASDNAPATPNAATALLRPFALEIGFEWDISDLSGWPRTSDWGRMSGVQTNRGRFSPSQLAVLYMFSLSMTKGEVLRYAIAFALRRSRKIIRGLKEGLTEEERFAVADHTVAQLKQRGDPWRLNEEAPAAKPPST